MTTTEQPQWTPEPGRGAGPSTATRPAWRTYWERIPAQWRTRPVLILAGVSLFMFLGWMSALGGGSTSPTVDPAARLGQSQVSGQRPSAGTGEPVQPAPTATTVQESPSPTTVRTTGAPAPTKTTVKTTAPTLTTTTQSLTVSQQQAIQSAESYLDIVGGFSRKGLIDQSEFEGFTQSQAEYGADSVGL